MQALWMVAASLLFATMGVCVKLASAAFNPAELVFWRGVIGVALLAWMARRAGTSLATRVPGMHAWRSLVGVVSLGAWFYAIGHLPLATATTLNYMSAIWIATFLVGASLAAWRPGVSGKVLSLQGPLVLTVLAGFGGVILVLRPTLAQDQLFAGLVGLMSGLTAAFAYLQVMTLSRIGEPETRTVFYFAVGSTVAGLLAMPVAGVSPWSWAHAPWLLPIGLLAAGGQLCMTRAYASARTQRGTLVVANLQYSGIVFSALYGMWVFGDRLPASAWAGMALIVASGIAATVLRERTAPDAPAEEH